MLKKGIIHLPTEVEVKGEQYGCGDPDKIVRSQVDECPYFLPPTASRSTREHRLNAVEYMGSCQEQQHVPDVAHHFLFTAIEIPPPLPTQNHQSPHGQAFRHDQNQGHPYGQIGCPRPPGTQFVGNSRAGFLKVLS